ncbi:hypothetical protein C3941_04410 [Kaistia algarum]|uniref:hypothetical protein n=1 Tax=Kaistia algarum TaxID=2083279 RepID=UPI000CE863F2|nr:hypothetical protein [Kaistia algarum]MCX5512539.1 hypothetical protein [Kaistia algarum]PPE81933.1 hypothetical protein C3941_04410 [Kaistia algarum]
MEPSRNLVLVHSREWQDINDFEVIRAYVEDMAADIEVFIVDNDARSSYTRKKAASRPSLIFSPIRLASFTPLRGKIYAGQSMSKLTEMGRLSAAGLPVPAYQVIEPGVDLSPETYGNYVIIKPAFEFASWGQGVELRRRENVRFQSPTDYPTDHPGRRGPMVAQKFIDCGRAMTCRVLTLFGTPIFTYCRESTRDLALDEATEPYQQAQFMPAPPDSVAYVTHDPNILALAAAAYRAMPEIALQACDILRAKTGELYLLEINPGGGTWMFSSRSAPGYKTRLGVDDLTTEFDAFETCARMLIEKTRAEAV